MCEEATSLIVRYLDALEECDRVHLMFLAAYRRHDAEATDAYRALLGEVKSKLHSASERFRDHRQRHNCSEVIRLEAEGTGPD